MASSLRRAVRVVERDVVNLVKRLLGVALHDLLEQDFEAGMLLDRPEVRAIVGRENRGEKIFHRLTCESSWKVNPTIFTFQAVALLPRCAPGRR